MPAGQTLGEGVLLSTLKLCSITVVFVIPLTSWAVAASVDMSVPLVIIFSSLSFGGVAPAAPAFLYQG